MYDRFVLLLNRIHAGGCAWQQENAHCKIVYDKERRQNRVCTVLLGLLFLLASPLVIPAWGTTENSGEIPTDRVWYASDFGAVPDGATVNTQALQKGIDTCSQAGGGTLRFTPGVWLSGSLILKDNVRLLLDQEAVLQASERREDYIIPDRTNVRGKPAFYTLGGKNEPSGFFIYADGAKNITLEGPGRIDGAGNAFWIPSDEFVRIGNDWRPRALICTINCDNVKCLNLKLTNSPCFTLWPIACRTVLIEKVIIDNPLYGPNTDGIDIDCCCDVSISDCHITGGDDAIAIKSDSGILGEEEIPCERVVVTNCTLCSRPACGVRLGYEGDSIIRDCTFSNLVIYASNIGLDILAIRPGNNAFTIIKGSRIENISFDNIVMRGVRQAIHLWTGNETDTPSQGYVKNIRYSNILAECDGGSLIAGSDEQTAKNIWLSNITLIPSGNMATTSEKTGASGVWGSRHPYGIFCYRAENVQLDAVTIDWSKASGAWLSAFACDKSSKIELHRFHTLNSAALPELEATAIFMNSDGTILETRADENLPLLKNVDSDVLQSGL